MSTFYFTTPVSDEDIRKVHIGDVIYLTGDITTGRDDVHIRVVVGGKESPVDLKGKAIFHAGPIMKKISAEGEPDKYKVISVGPTTSMRMEKAQAEFLKATGAKIIIGKGGAKLKEISSKAREELEKHFGCKVYLKCFVKVKRDWENNAGLLDSLGFTQE